MIVQPDIVQIYVYEMPGFLKNTTTKTLLKVIHNTSLFSLHTLCIADYQPNSVIKRHIISFRNFLFDVVRAEPETCYSTH